MSKPLYTEYVEEVQIVDLVKILDAKLSKKKTLGTKVIYAIILSKILKKCLYNGMDRKISDDSISVWLNHKRFVEEFAFLELTVRRFEEYLRDFKSAELIRFTHVRNKFGSKCYYTFTESGISLFSDKYKQLYFKQIEEWKKVGKSDPPY